LIAASAAFAMTKPFIYRFEGQMGWCAIIGVKMKRFVPLALLVGSLALSTQAHAQCQTSGVKIGTLSCHVQSSWGFIFGSSLRAGSGS
jgi:hypothetical protein